MKNTGMNNKGPERKERRAAVLVCAFLSVLLLACLLTGVAAAADSEGSEGAAEPVNPKVIEFASDGGNLKITIDYDENALFSSSATGYNLKLAQASIAMAGAAFSSPGVEYDASGPDAAKARYKNLETAYGQLGFSKMEFHNYDKPLNKTDDCVAYGIAEKTITVNSETWTLFAVQVRGSEYAGEWVSNFHIDQYPIDGVDYSAGFGKPAEVIAKEVYGKLEKKIEGIQSPGEGQPKKIKIWISGFSRAAAVSNALGGELTRHADTYLGLSADNIYVYTFATPNTVLINSLEDDGTNYDNIYNTLNPCDIVPVVPMSTTLNKWDYGKYGQTHYFNYGAYDPKERSDISNKYKEITGDEYDPYTPTSNTVFLPVLFELCFSQTVPRDEYIADFYPYLKEIMSLVFCGEEQDAARLLALNNNLDLLPLDKDMLKAAKEMTKEYSKENEELDDRVLSFLISRALEILWLFSDDTNNAVSNRASNSSDERQGTISQFTDGTTTIGFYKNKSWDKSKGVLTTTSNLVDNLLAEISALKDSGYKITNITTITKEHNPEVYMSVLFSGIDNLDRLFAANHPALNEIYAIVYDTKGGKLDDGKYVEVHPIYIQSDPPIPSDPVDLSEKKPTKAGYTFSGWVNEKGQSITKVDISKPGYTRVTAVWASVIDENGTAVSVIDENGTAKINEGNIDTITLPGISESYIVVKERPASELSDGSISVSAVTLKYDSDPDQQPVLLAASAASSDSNLQDSDTSAVIYFSIPEETAEYLAELSPSYDIINHPELVVLKCSDDDGDWDNLETTYVEKKYDEDDKKFKYRYCAYADSLSLDIPFSFAVCVHKFIPKKRSPSPQGTSIWHTAEPTPEPTLEPTPTPTMEVPVVVPLKPAAQTSQSPAPFAGIAAGLVAAAVLFGMRRR